MESKLGLNLELVNQARQSAAHVADDTQRFIDQHTTVTVERAVCRLLGIDGVNEMDVPLPNVVVDHMMATSFLPMGAAWAIGNAMLETGKDPQAVAEAIDKGELTCPRFPLTPTRRSAPPSSPWWTPLWLASTRTLPSATST